MNMTNIKGFALIMVGILVFTGSCIYASELYSKPTAQESTELEDQAWDLLEDIRESDALVEDGGGAGTFDHDKVMTVEADDLGIEDHENLEFQFEIIDVSDAEETYSRDFAHGNQIKTSSPPTITEEGQVVVIHSAATIHVGPDEVHSARLQLTVWEGG
jgi:hypothetical protein